MVGPGEWVAWQVHEYIKLACNLAEAAAQTHGVADHLLDQRAHGANIMDHAGDLAGSRLAVVRFVIRISARSVSVAFRQLKAGVFREKCPQIRIFLDDFFGGFA